MDLNSKWKNIVNHLDYAYQPVVNTYSGTVFGFESLLRGWDLVGFKGIHEVFNEAYQDQQLYQLDLYLRDLAIRKLIESEKFRNFRLLYNLDNRVLEMPDYKTGNTSAILKKYNLNSRSILFELSEKHEFDSFSKMSEILNIYREQKYQIAIDDYGSGYSGLQLLYHSEPDFIKIDRFFIIGIDQDSKKKLFLSNIVNMAHIMGIQVIAEGVETDKEFFACKDIGCDFVQGFLIQKPTRFTDKLRGQYHLIQELVDHNRRAMEGDQDLIKYKTEYLDPIFVHTEIRDVLDQFKRNKDKNCFPVLNHNNEPIGIINEKTLKNYVYSPYGQELLKNKSSGRDVMHFISKIPIADINSPAQKILEIFSTNTESEGIIITEEGIYKGYLSANALLFILNQKEVASARDQNPLSKLPGNNAISQFVSEFLNKTDLKAVFTYFDFDKFKPYNDKYGFRQGDRVILLFADILREILEDENVFIGHIGGDDFFAGFDMRFKDWNVILNKIHSTIKRFKDDVLPFYNQQEREQGYIISKSREGATSKFGLLEVSAGVVYIVQDNQFKMTPEDLGFIIAELKKKAKHSKEKIAVEKITPQTWKSVRIG